MNAGEHNRKIIHVDMDAFFAAVEQRDHPHYRDKPIIVGGKPNSRGVVATCSYQARRFGIHSAMPSSQAYRLCPQAIFVRPRFDVYKQVSAQIREIFASFSSVYEPVSLDEAYLDVSAVTQYKGSATLIAKAIKQKILAQTGLVASAGVSYNKFLAKIASDMDKPDGLYLITPEEGELFVENLEIGKFHGIGRATEKKMHDLNIFTGKDLKALPLAQLEYYFGKSGKYYFHISRGVDHRPVVNSRISKSVSVETTFAEDISGQEEILCQLHILLEDAWVKLQGKQMIARTLVIKVKYQDFEQITRSRTFSNPIGHALNMKTVLAELIAEADTSGRKVRLLGVGFSSLSTRSALAFKQMDLFE